MVKKDIIKYLKEGISKGFSKDLLRQELIKNGFAKKDIGKAINSLGNQISKKIKSKIERPVGVLICSIIFYAMAIYLIIYSIPFILKGAFSSEGMTQIGMLVAIFVNIPISILFLFVGRGLHKARSWSRILAIILSLLIFIVSIVLIPFGVGLGIFATLMQGIIMLIAGGFVAGYLLFNKKAKEFFKKSTFF